jgi:hypothetical protein
MRFILNKERARVDAHGERCGAARQCGSTERAAIERVRDLLAAAETAAASFGPSLATSDASSTALERARALAELSTRTEALIESRGALEALVSSLYTVDDWRRIAHVDADSIVEERRLRAEVLRQCDGADP